MGMYKYNSIVCYGNYKLKRNFHCDSIPWKLNSKIIFKAIQRQMNYMETQKNFGQIHGNAYIQFHSCYGNH